MTKQYSVDGTGHSFKVKFEGEIKFKHFGLPNSMKFQAESEKAIEEMVNVFKRECDKQEVKELEFVGVEFTQSSKDTKEI